MARSVRQSKIIEIINKQEIETQDELVDALKSAGFDVTQATISRDIKELGLFKIAGKSKKYRYAFVDNEDRNFNSKANEMYKSVVLSIANTLNQVVVKTIRGTTLAVAGVVDRLAITSILGIVTGDDTILIITDSEENAKQVKMRLEDLLNN